MSVNKNYRKKRIECQYITKDMLSQRAYERLFPGIINGNSKASVVFSSKVQKVDTVILKSYISCMYN